MQHFIPIALGGAIGAVTRYLVAQGFHFLLGRSFPFGTLFINVSGCFLMGFLTELFLQRFAVSVEYRAALLVGFLGAYTTFSTFALETLYLFEQGSLLKAFLNVFLSVVMCLMACWVGLILGRMLFTDNIEPVVGLSRTYIYLIFGYFTAFLLAILLELQFQIFNVNNEIRTTGFILLLAILTVASTLWFYFRLPTLQLETHAIMSIFIINALFGAILICAGSWLGNYLWQLKLLP